MTYEYLGQLALPSGVAAEDFFDGKPGSLTSLITSFIGRAGIISVGGYMAGLHGKQLFKVSVFSSLAVETFVLLFALYSKQQKPAVADAI